VEYGKAGRSSCVTAWRTFPSRSRRRQAGGLGPGGAEGEPPYRAFNSWTAWSQSLVVSVHTAYSLIDFSNASTVKACSSHRWLEKRNEKIYLTLKGRTQTWDKKRRQEKKIFNLSFFSRKAPAVQTIKPFYF